MCTMCNGKTYGQDQPKEREADRKKLQRWLDKNKDKQ
jgi:hypothetical protein